MCFKLLKTAITGVIVAGNSGQSMPLQMDEVYVVKDALIMLMTEREAESIVVKFSNQYTNIV